MANLLVVLIKDETPRTAAGGTELHYGTLFTVQEDLTLEALVTEAIAAPMLAAGRVKIKGETAEALAARVAFMAAAADLATKREAVIAATEAAARTNDALVAVTAIETAATAAKVAAAALDDAADTAVTDATAAFDTASGTYDTTLAAAIAAAAVVEVPGVTAFTVGAVTLLEVAIASFTASDNKAVTGYLITESDTPPLIAAEGWTAEAPETYTADGAKTANLYPWVKDASGRVSGVFATPREVIFTTE